VNRAVAEGGLLGDDLRAGRRAGSELSKDADPLVVLTYTRRRWSLSGSGIENSEPPPAYAVAIDA